MGWKEYSRGGFSLSVKEKFDILVRKLIFNHDCPVKQNFLIVSHLPDKYPFFNHRAGELSGCPAI